MADGEGEMVSAGAAALQLLAGWVEHECPACQIKFHARPGYGDVCADCSRARAENAQREREADAIRAAADSMLEPWLTVAGLSKRELTARTEKISPTLAQRLRHPELNVAQMVNGSLPAKGFGLSGSAGRGKTYALVAIFRAHVLARWKRKTNHGGRAEADHWMDWVRWPERVNEMRVRSTRDDGLGAVAPMISRMASVPVLVVDDLGAERMRGEYVDDWAASQLDLVVDARYNAMLPTWYTTNLNAAEFVTRYGARFTSRLTSENVMVAVPDGPDLRTVARGGANGTT